MERKTIGGRLFRKKKKYNLSKRERSYADGAELAKTHGRLREKKRARLKKTLRGSQNKPFKTNQKEQH